MYVLTQMHKMEFSKFVTKSNFLIFQMPFEYYCRTLVLVIFWYRHDLFQYEASMRAHVTPYLLSLEIGDLILHLSSYVTRKPFYSHKSIYFCKSCEHGRKIPSCRNRTWKYICLWRPKVTSAVSSLNVPTSPLPMKISKFNLFDQNSIQMWKLYMELVWEKAPLPYFLPLNHYISSGLSFVSQQLIFFNHT